MRAVESDLAAKAAALHVEQERAVEMARRHEAMVPKEDAARVEARGVVADVVCCCTDRNHRFLGLYQQTHLAPRHLSASVPVAAHHASTAVTSASLCRVTGPVPPSPQERARSAEEELRRVEERLVVVQRQADDAHAAASQAEVQSTAATAELHQLRAAVREMAQRSDASMAVARYTEEVVGLRQEQALLRSQLTRSERDRERLVHANLSLERSIAQVRVEERVLGSRGVDGNPQGVNC